MVESWYATNTDRPPGATATDDGSARGRAGGNALTSFHEPVSQTVTDVDPSCPVTTARNRSSADRAIPPIADTSPPFGSATLGTFTAGSTSAASSARVAVTLRVTGPGCPPGDAAPSPGPTPGPSRGA